MVYIYAAFRAFGWLKYAMYSVITPPVGGLRKFAQR
jgi:hypothetical protein